MASLLDQTLAALDFASRIRFLTPPPGVDPLRPEALDLATSLFAAHLAAVAPSAAGPLPVAKVEAHASFGSVQRRLGMTAEAVEGAPRRPFGASPKLPELAPETSRWFQATSQAWTGAIDRQRADPSARKRLRELEGHFGVRSKATDPYQAFDEVLAEPMRVARWEHPHRALSETAPTVGERLHQSAARALESHLRWALAYGDDPGRPSPWWPVLQLWKLGLWPIPAQDGALLLFAPPLAEGRMVFDPAQPTTLGTRMSPSQGDPWSALDRLTQGSMMTGLGAAPGHFTFIHGNPPAVPRPR